ncbi:hypothetical protein [Parasphingorhabdus cellanae]|uniref:DUF2569 domain-containing protein n=1 Tax=Parasphingorhabdus cellanae TaxID=2806553 RepID=A0ABX7TAA0_9SPHN|nr:hypothetical protein [Parasphingorhabdus cellanae]QTD57118.1 hypothetical protein J4G78_06095 [Parasphingorhabdus cellanae]
MRPNSIIRFEQLFLGALALNVLNIILNWDTWSMVMDQGDGSDGMNAFATYTIIIFPFLINLWLWFKIARKASNIGKWLLIVMFLIGVIWSLATIDNYRTLGLTILFTILALKAAAIYMLFRRDAKQWFAGKAVAT